MNWKTWFSNLFSNGVIPAEQIKEHYFCLGCFADLTIMDIDTEYCHFCNYKFKKPFIRDGCRSKIVEFGNKKNKESWVHSYIYMRYLQN